MVDAVKNLMSTITNTILQQVTEQVKKTMEAVNSARPLPTFDYLPTARCEPCHRHALIGWHRRSDEVRETAHLERDKRSLEGNRNRSMGVVSPHTNIIMWDCLKKLEHLGREIIPLVHPILGFGSQEVNPIGMIRLPLRFGDKVKARNLDVDFLAVDVPIVDNVIMGRPTLHNVKAIIASYLLQLQFEIGDGSVGKL
ncbi:hypothetical protein Cgig2_030068 [Carnegiea gigantea]|uniref:Uncharacterized protein n=1 Tax=Carnegiea gigantea TaxID=171969 RepID=A0A9Q1GQ46_9CARY|nr:hypothetical protein Cgig2_030068 [Carnegiea gigantea]